MESTPTPARTSTRTSARNAMKTAKTLLTKLKKLNPALFEKDFLRTWDKSSDDLHAVVLVAQILEELYKENIDCRVFHGGVAVSNFRDNSTRVCLYFFFFLSKPSIVMYIFRLASRSNSPLLSWAWIMPISMRVRARLLMVKLV